MLSKSGQSKRSGQSTFSKKNTKAMKAHLMKFIKKLENNDTNTAKPAASVNVATAKIEEILKETPTVTEVKAEPAKPSQESAPKQLQFL